MLDSVQHALKEEEAPAGSGMPAGGGFRTGFN